MALSRPDRDILEWDTSNWSKALDFWEAHGPSSMNGMTVLDVGARNGGLSLWAALRGAEVTCSDCFLPLKKARPLHQAYGLSSQINYVEADVVNLPFESNRFDGVMLKSVLGAVGHDERFERQCRACREIHRVLKPGGWFLFAENARASFLHRSLRRFFTPHGARWRYLGLDELPMLLSPFASWSYQSFGVLGLLGRSERQRDTLSRLDTLLEPAVPSRWRYAVCGMARKSR